MNFENAFKELLKGKKIRRKEWEPLMHLKFINDNIKAYTGESTYIDENCNLLLINDWKVVNGDGKLLTFIEALEELKSKKCITRESMGEAYIFIDGNLFTLCKPIEYKFMPTFKCLCANDWEIMK